MDMLSILTGLNSSDALLGVVKQTYPNIVHYDPAKQFVTPQALSLMMPTMKKELAVSLAGIFNQLCPLYHLNSMRVFPEYITECAHESELFTRFEERLNYSAKRLTEVWPKRFPTITAALPYAYNPQKLANKAYANRMGNGDEASGDGFMYRGGGGIHMTGHDMYLAYLEYKKMNVELAYLVDKVRKDLFTAIDSSMWVFVVNKKLLDEAEADDIDTISHAINGGSIGLAERKALYKKALKAFPEN